MKKTGFKYERTGLNCKVFFGLPCKSTTSSEQIHKGHTNEAIHIQDQVGFLIQQNQQRGFKKKKKGLWNLKKGVCHYLVKAVKNKNEVLLWRW